MQFFLNACSQKPNLKYDESKFRMLFQGRYPDGRFLSKHVSLIDSNLIMEKVFKDSTFDDVIFKSFFYKGLSDGPFESYVFGKVYRRGFLKNGQDDGERITFFENGLIYQKAYFKQGRKVGTWAEYNLSGKLVKETIYDDAGEIIKVTHYDD